MRLIATLLLAIFVFIANPVHAQTSLARLPALEKKFPIAHADAMSMNPQDQKSIECLALNIYFEARGTTLQDQVAVAYVTVNRVHSRQFETDVCSTVFQYTWIKKQRIPQFTWTINRPVPRMIEHDSWQHAQQIAYNVYTQRVDDPTNGALFFHDRDDYDSVRWRHHTGKVFIGSHVFLK